jgi:hypothetical protein
MYIVACCNALPSSIIIVCGATVSLLATHSFFCLVDLGIYLKILQQFRVMVQLLLFSLSAISFGMLTRFDSRGIGFILMAIPSAFTIVGYDATNKRQRSTVVYVHVCNAVLYLTFLTLVNVGAMPNLDVNSTVWTFYINEVQIPFSTLSVFNQNEIAKVFFILNNILFAVFWPNRLASAAVLLEGVDHPSSTPLEQTDFSYKREANKTFTLMSSVQPVTPRD